MSAALDLFAARAIAEEAKRRFAYNDATGARVTCQPGGNLSIGVGINLETGLDEAEIEWLFRHRAGLVEQQLAPLSWYASSPPAQQSVALDMGFNLGMHGLLEFVTMLHDFAIKDWLAARQALLASKAATEDPARYKALADLLAPEYTDAAPSMVA